jgi:hypothetical protein
MCDLRKTNKRFERNQVALGELYDDILEEIQEGSGGGVAAQNAEGKDSDAESSEVPASGAGMSTRGSKSKASFSVGEEDTPGAQGDEDPTDAGGVSGGGKVARGRKRKEPAVSESVSSSSSIAGNDIDSYLLTEEEQKKRYLWLCI